ncbi:MAG: hypothetical protein GX321_02815 [Clostridiales bacterium]|nr:hypothetical protein [Clostridiales bacterium]
MADNGLLHTAELLKTALPYVDVRSRLTLDLLLKLFELLVCLRNFRTNNIAACSYDNTEKADMESLLYKIKPKCNEKEAAFVDKMLSVFQAKKIFEMYNTYMDVMNTMEGFEGFSKEGTKNDFASNFMSNFTGFDFSSVDLSQVFAGNKEDNYSDVTGSEEMVDIEEATDIEEVDIEEADIKEVANSDYDGEGNMFDSLKSMISPDQMETFERLRMLFDSQSYDDNSKSKDDKE